MILGDFTLTNKAPNYPPDWLLNYDQPGGIVIPAHSLNCSKRWSQPNCGNKWHPGQKSLISSHMTGSGQ